MHKRLKQPIFLISSERSGSNLIRVIHGSHPNIAAPAPPNFLMTFLPKMPFYGDLTKEKNYNSFLEDVVQVIKHQVGEWKSSFSVSELKQNIASPSLPEVFDYVYAKEMQIENKQRIFIKENESFYHIYYILSYYPDARLVYLIRDGRDFAVSYLKSPNHFGTLEMLAKKWSVEQRQSLIAYSDLMSKGNIHYIHYEDLVNEPRKIIQELCGFLDESFTESMLDFHRKEDVVRASKSVKNWSNLSKPIMTSQVKRYQKHLSKDEVFLFESIAYEELLLCGYTLENSLEELVNKSSKKHFLSKSFQFLKKIVTGKTLSWEELNRRRQIFKVNDEINQKLKKNIQPLLPLKTT